MLTILIPGLILSETDAATALPPLPNLQLIASRANRAKVAGAYPYEQLALQCGLPALPLAAAAGSKLDLPIHEGYWLRSDPFAMQVSHNAVYCLGNASLNLSREEATEMIQSLNIFLAGDAIRFYLGEKPTDWYMQVPEAKALATTPFEQILGKSILEHLPQGEDAPLLEALLAEIQMSLFAHPVNVKRRAQGLPTIDSLWVYGNGQLPATLDWPWQQTYADDAAILGLAKAAGKAEAKLPLSAAEIINAKQTVLVVYEPLRAALAQGNASLWQQALQDLESNWLKPAVQALRQNQLQQLELVFADKHYQLTRGQLWRFWRRSLSLESIVC
jgi:hypothetical protein